VAPGLAPAAARRPARAGGGSLRSRPARTVSGKAGGRDGLAVGLSGDGVAVGAGRAGPLCALGSPSAVVGIRREELRLARASRRRLAWAGWRLACASRRRLAWADWRRLTWAGWRLICSGWRRVVAAGPRRCRLAAEATRREPSAAGLPVSAGSPGAGRRSGRPVTPLARPGLVSILAPAWAADAIE
jgi:hypothetical protein